jgi:hypothetical protein
LRDHRVSGNGALVIFLLEKAVPGAKFRFVNFKGGGEAVTSTPEDIPRSRPRT